ncbi:MAG: histidine phosphatase family protein [Bacteroidota bacterium]|nr:histidine phosphatase family protein [Bacteroidota bacterium]
MRHAKSSWRDADWFDIERPLNDRGRSDIPLMILVLHEKVKKIDKIITSPANRAMMTARLIAEGLEYNKDDIEVKEVIYESEVKQILDLIKNLDNNWQSVMLVGHNPEFSLCLEELTGLSYRVMPTAAVAGIEFNVKSWKDIKEGKGSLLLFDFPKKYKKEEL